MPKQSRQLGIWVGTDLIAVLERRRRYEITCHYLEPAFERWSLNTPVISCSLPLSDLRMDAVPFCRGLLPEGEALQAAAMQARVSVIDVFELLACFGRDIAGALVISAETPPARDAAAVRYSADQLDQEVAELPANPLGLHDDSELSLAGMQNKILLVRQEDICQALGIDPIENRGRVKYERYGGPTFAQLAELLSAAAQVSPSELDRLVQIMTFNVLVGNADAHGKNLSLLHDPLGTVRLAPLYDTVPTLLWQMLRKTAAMRVNGRELLTQVTLADLVAEASSWRYSADRAKRVATDLIERALDAASAPTVPGRLRTLLEGQARQLLAE